MDNLRGGLLGLKLNETSSAPVTVQKGDTPDLRAYLIGERELSPAQLAGELPAALVSRAMRDELKRIAGRAAARIARRQAVMNSPSGNYWRFQDLAEQFRQTAWVVITTAVRAGLIPAPVNDSEDAATAFFETKVRCSHLTSKGRRKPVYVFISPETGGETIDSMESMRRVIGTHISWVWYRECGRTKSAAESFDSDIHEDGATRLWNVLRACPAITERLTVLAGCSLREQLVIAEYLLRDPVKGTGAIIASELGIGNGNNVLTIKERALSRIAKYLASANRSCSVPAAAVGRITSLVADIAAAKGDEQERLRERLAHLLISQRGSVSRELIGR